MTEYIEREEVLKHKRKMSGADFGGEFWDKAVLCEDIRKIPAADVVEVVRCKDCLFGYRDYNYEYGYTCVKPLYHPAIGEMTHIKLVQDCDYCSHGVRNTN